jgi:TetR/AcrR family transcriptional regulator
METTNTEEKIIQAAEIEFIERGFDGARMQAIADKAGINKALLHYYFRSKQKLFEVIFKTAIKFFLPKIIGIFSRNDLGFQEKIRLFVSAYIDLISKHPHIPMFVLHELSNNASTLLKIIQEIKLDISPVKNQIKDEIAKGTIINIIPEQLILNVLSLSIFPIVASPIARELLVEGNKEAYKALIEERKTHVAEFVIRAISISQDNSTNQKS